MAGRFGIDSTVHHPDPETLAEILAVREHQPAMWKRRGDGLLRLQGSRSARLPVYTYPCVIRGKRVLLCVRCIR